jgi:CelD/BcsL family acetyltransferase involved in cellulose biosynthesis
MSTQGCTLDLVRVARTEEEVESLRPQWAALRFGHLDADLDVFQSVVRTLPEARRPHVVVGERDGVPVALLVARLEERELPVRFGYATVLRPRVRCLTVISGGMAGPDGAEEPLVGELLASLRRREADVVLFHRVTVGSSLHGQAVTRPSRWSRQRFLVPARHWAMELPPSGDKLLPSLPKKLRDNFKSRRRGLEREYGDRMQIRRFDGPEHAADAIADLERIAATTYQRGLGAGFSAERDSELVQLGLERGWFRAWILYLDGAPVAFELGTRHHDTFVVGAKGYDPSTTARHVGWPVQLRMLEDLADDPAIRTVDFGFGDADYKRRLATTGWDETDVLVYGRTARALTANAGSTVVLGTDRLARRLVGKERIAKVKRRWRTLRTPAAAAS